MLKIAGASFIKLGQWAASRTDIFPEEMCNELGSLHSNAKAHSLELTKKIISKSFGNLPFDEIFDEFKEKPLGVGAIAQVYLGKLSPKVLERAKKDEDKLVKQLKLQAEDKQEQFLKTLLLQNTWIQMNLLPLKCCILMLNSKSTVI